jgi:transposase
MAEPTSCCVVPGGYCARVDSLFNLPGVHVLDVAWLGRRRKLPPGLTLVVETEPAVTGCLGCGVVAESRGRRVRRLHDIPAFGPLREGLRRLAAFPRERFHRRERHRHAGPVPWLRNAIRDELDDAVAVLDAFHLVRLGLKAM